MKIAIILPYFKRPNLVKNALKSILNSNYKNWELLFNDDASPVPGEPIVREIIKNKVKFYRTEMTIEEKLASGGILGKALNQMIRETDVDIGFVLCDDDAIMPDYMDNLVNYFSNNINLACYSHVKLWNPEKEDLESAINKNVEPNQFNEWVTPIFSKNCHDWSQVAWRIKEVRNAGIWFPETNTPKNHDAAFFETYNRTIGPTHFSGCIGQLKAWWPRQQSNVDWYAANREGVNIDY